MWLGDKIQKAKKDIRLDPQRKEEMLQFILQSIEVQRAERVLRPGGDDRRTWQRSIMVFFRKPMPIFALIAALVLAGGGTSLAAQGSLPGDTLYPVKVSINEKVAGAFQLSDEAKANWNARLAELRLEEAAQLKAKGKVSVENEVELKNRFEAFADRVEQRIEAMKEKGRVEAATDVATRFEAALQAHKAILARLEASANATSTTGTSTPIVLRLDNVLGKFMGIRMRAEKDEAVRVNASTTESAALGKIGAAENVIASVEASIERRDDRVNADAKAKAEATLAAAKSLIVDAKVKVTAKDYAKAFELAQEALRKAHEAKIYLNVGVGMKIRFDNSSTTASSTVSSTLNVNGLLRLKLR